MTFGGSLQQRCPGYLGSPELHNMVIKSATNLFFFFFPLLEPVIIKPGTVRVLQRDPGCAVQGFYCSQRGRPRFQQRIRNPRHNENPYIKNDRNYLLLVSRAQQAAAAFRKRNTAVAFLNYVT